MECEAEGVMRVKGIFVSKQLMEKQNEYSSFQTEVGGVENSRRRDAQSGIRNILRSPEIN